MRKVQQYRASVGVCNVCMPPLTASRFVQTAYSTEAFWRNIRYISKRTIHVGTHAWLALELLALETEGHPWLTPHMRISYDTHPVDR